MKRKGFWKRVKGGGISSITEFIILLLSVIASIILLLFDFLNIIILSPEKQLSLIIILLSILVAANISEKYGILSELRESIYGLDETHPYLTVRQKYEKIHPLDELLTDATELNLLAIANTSFLKGNGLTHLTNAVRKGIRVKIISLQPQSAAEQLYTDSKILNQVSIPLIDNIESYLNVAKHDKKVRELVEMKVCDLIIPYSMIIIKKNNQVTYMKVDLYSMDVEYPDRRSLIIPINDFENINFFLDQWEKYWNHASSMVVTKDTFFIPVFN